MRDYFLIYDKIYSFSSKLSQENKPRNELMCRKCLTPWLLGKFELSTIPSNHHRKRRRQFQIERLQKEIKSGKSSKGDAVKLTRKLKRLQQLNNHVAVSFNSNNLSHEMT